MPSASWGPQSAGAFIVPGGTVSAEIGFLGLNQFLDQLYINTTDNF
jgi:hypothetical protein